MIWDKLSFVMDMKVLELSSLLSPTFMAFVDLEQKTLNLCLTTGHNHFYNNPPIWGKMKTTKTTAVAWAAHDEG